MTIEQQPEEKPTNQKSKKVYTTSTKPMDFASGFVGWFVMMTIVVVILNAVAWGMGPSALVLGILGLPIISVMQIIVTLTLFKKRLWTALGVVGAVVFNLALSVLLGMSEGYYAFPITSDQEFASKASALFTNISAMTRNPTFAPAPADDPAVDALARSGVTANAEWTPYTQDFDGVMMVLVPVGCFTMGDQYEHGGQQCFDMPFWVDLDEVSNGQFNRLGGHTAYASSTSGDDEPRVNITWFETINFCASRGARLLTDAEWEYAGRGPDNLVYPWGNEYRMEHPVGGPSWVGALDMKEGVGEWTSSLSMEYPYNPTDGREAMFTFNPFEGRGVRTGDLGLSSRHAKPPTSHYDDDGFRCGRPY